MKFTDLPILHGFKCDFGYIKVQGIKFTQYHATNVASGKSFMLGDDQKVEDLGRITTQHISEHDLNELSQQIQDDLIAVLDEDFIALDNDFIAKVCQTVIDRIAVLKAKLCHHRH